MLVTYIVYLGVWGHVQLQFHEPARKGSEGDDEKQACGTVQNYPELFLS